ncbi:MAG: hypothetical protein AAF739_04120 [Pseudomonadota bacterium]
MGSLAYLARMEDELVERLECQRHQDGIPDVTDNEPAHYDRSAYRQTENSVLLVGIFSLVESVLQVSSFEVANKRPRCFKELLRDQFSYLGPELIKELEFWSRVVNVLKHGNGPSYKKLEELNAERSKDKRVTLIARKEGSYTRNGETYVTYPFVLGPLPYLVEVTLDDVSECCSVIRQVFHAVFEHERIETIERVRREAAHK